MTISFLSSHSRSLSLPLSLYIIPWNSSIFKTSITYTQDMYVLQTIPYEAHGCDSLSTFQEKKKQRILAISNVIYSEFRADCQCWSWIRKSSKQYNLIFFSLSKQHGVAYLNMRLATYFVLFLVHFCWKRCFEFGLILLQICKMKKTRPINCDE